MYTGQVDKIDTQKLERHEWLKEIPAAASSATHLDTNEPTCSSVSDHKSSDDASHFNTRFFFFSLSVSGAEIVSSLQKIFQYSQSSKVIGSAGISNWDACKVNNACLKDLKTEAPQYILNLPELFRQRICWK